MKLLFHFLLTILAATLTLAAPTRHLQLPLADKKHHTPSTHAPSTHASAATSSSKPSSKSTSTHTAHTPKIHLPYVVKAPASAAHAHKKHRLSVPSWLKVWEASSKTKHAHHHHHNGMHFAHASSADLACFCAGGAICCHTATGLDCNAGYCGI